MVELTHTAYATIRVNDPRYTEKPRFLRADVLKALALIHATHKQLFGEKYDAPYVTIYKDKKKVTIKYRWPQDWNGQDPIFGVLRKDDIYEHVLGLVMDGR